MKWIYYIVVFFVFVFTFSCLFCVHQVLAEEKKEEAIFYPKHEIHMDVPTISDPLLKQLVMKKLNSFKNEFLKSICGVADQKDFTYTFFVTSKIITYQNYVSLAFFIETYTGGAHPNHDIWTIVYDKNQKQVVSFDVQFQKNPSFLSFVSTSVRGDFFFSPHIFNTLWMMEGTQPKKENFERFLFTEKGILFYFIPYQIAPYSSGTFEAIVPYF